MRVNSMILKWLSVLLIAWQANALSAEIYRCEHGDVVEFSDRPCQEDATPHQARRQISIITPATDLEETARRNRAFLEQRRERLEADRNEDEADETPADDRDDEPPSDYTDRETLYLPNPSDTARRSRERERRERLEESDRRNADRERFSPLTGRLPGARRRDDDN